MKVSSKYVGSHTHTIEFDVSHRTGMNYAAAMDDYNPLYFDELRPGGVVAPPMACLALSWPLCVDFERTWEASSFGDAFPYEILERRVHFSEHLTCHQPVRPGMRLRLQGTMTTLLPRKGGSYMAIRYAAIDAISGEPVFTECTGVFLRMVRCTDEGQGAEAVPNPPVRPDAAEPIWTVDLPLSPLTPYIYDGCTNMHFPIHTSPAFAKSVRLSGTIVQGAATLSLAVKELTNREAGADPTRIEVVGAGFSGMVIPGTPISIRLLARQEINGKTILFFDVLNHEGKQAVSNGFIQLQPSLL